MKSIIIISFISLLQIKASGTPAHFVDVKEAIPSIDVEIRYATKYNFIGKPIDGYLSNKCYLQKRVVDKLKLVQKKLLTSKLSLKLYDCYRPQKSVDQFYKWSQEAGNNNMKSVFYPNIEKQKLFTNKYLAKYSKHSKGIALDVTLVKLKDRPTIMYYDSSQKDCTETSRWPEGENSIEMGTTYDCLDDKSSTNSKMVSKQAQENRKILRRFMEKQGFKNYSKEWWHYTLPEVKEKNYYNFDIK